MDTIVSSLQSCFQTLTIACSPRSIGKIVDAPLSVQTLENTLKERSNPKDLKGEWWLKWHHVLEQASCYPPSSYRQHDGYQRIYDITMEYLIALYGMRFDEIGCYILTQRPKEHACMVEFCIDTIVNLCQSGVRLYLYGSRLVALCNGLMTANMTLVPKALRLYKIIFADDRMLDNKIIRLLVTGTDIDAYYALLMSALDNNDIDGVIALERVLRYIHSNGQLPRSAYTVMRFQSLLVRHLDVFSICCKEQQQQQEDGLNASCGALFSMIQFLSQYLQTANAYDAPCIKHVNATLSPYLASFDDLLSFEISAFLAKSILKDTFTI